MDYIYESLKPNSIRLLRLAPGEWNAPICCDLYQAPLDESHPYEALSYCWGSADNRPSISLNNCPHLVTKNLEAALRHLRLENKPRKLWVDALCINQESFEDKNAQVLMMDEIYRRSQNVVSWLGEASHESDEAMRTMRILGRWARDNESDIFDGPSKNQEHLTVSEYFEAKGFPMSSQNWSAVLSLLERPYWTRVWIIQELAVKGFLFRSTGDIICGTSSISRIEFDVACVAILLTVQGSSARGTGSSFDVDEPLRSILLRGWPPGLAMIQTISACNGPEKPTLTTLIEVSTRFEASNCRDKIFALRGLACERDRLLQPDYEQPVSTVLMNVVDFLITSWGNLHILLGNRFEVNPDGPSWTPDLGSRLRGDTTLRIFNKTFKADDGQGLNVEMDKSLGTLSCKGILLAIARRVIGPYIQGQKPADGADNYQEVTSGFGNRQFFAEICDFCRPLSETDKTLLCRTLVMDHDSATPGEDPSYPAPAEFVDMMQAVFEQKPVPESFIHEGSRIDRWIQYTAPFSKSIENASSNRCFFVTESGGMGMGPFSMKPGDIIVVLFGSPFCLVLRSVQGTDRFNLIGDAYVHGAMGGEFVKSARPDEYRTFVLA
ncbi:uncharacterized protein FMAN_11946 [Fusarium mangiferae]|uniref:Heterokaryon incompatibility domain-containing protein n=1 Tax=Fusarium mangiferae TaxID=192010 RepID=A0A1L7UCH3_FUSMA|nr:uncharacterized protein FMAN_11946 [Fusarium mangiferae]CVL06852.1 uncharacterized protein FMAN_11946 [Fusarium mangiferae]